MVPPSGGDAALASVRSPGLTAAPEQTAPAPAEAPAAAVPVATVEAPAPGAQAPAADESCALSAEDLEGDDDTSEAGDAEGDVGEGETPVVGGEVPTGPLYTADISDEELARRWKGDVAALGSMAVGFAHSGRLVNGVQFPKGDDWIVVSPEIAWGTQESIDYMVAAIKEVRARYPFAPLLRVNGISNKDGGHKRPHKSHQNGRDVDVGFYYPTVDPIREREREKYINVPLNWALVRAVVTKTDIQLILVDKRVQKVLYDYALSVGEDKAWLDSLFSPVGIIRHARRHRDHFHMRFHNPRAQELGRRVQPLLALQPEHNVTTHRVRSGDTLGGIALRYGSTVTLIRKANRMRNTFLRAGQRLSVPLRGPCTHCPVPPPVVLPSRNLPPEPKAPLVAAAPSAEQSPVASNCVKPAAPVDQATTAAAAASGAVTPASALPAAQPASTLVDSAPPSAAALPIQPAPAAMDVSGAAAPPANIVVPTPAP
ncbi:LysM domain-containing protein [Myxococcus stipitatus DSM 14675]|uniref:LysM domain-containing protein n=1 Tax=Myxococcus stipitatus (strain DSM 14675 / JCM 12634 / Mx s8) TaxID=1278073 RepID=L7U8V1_MYXSD|nr:penicillin-insensitive murein endopeptidase [Myxococcus stipitatus]AGC43972.1 LysM domain-containing protein [Myxococcus stipitatus DSM 14675]